MCEKFEMFIGGSWCQGHNADQKKVINPASEEVLGFLPQATVDDLDRALSSAERGFDIWRKTSAYDRSRIILKAADLIRNRVDSIAETLTLEQGKVLSEAKLEVLAAADTFEWYAEEGKRAYGRIVPSRIAGARMMVVKEPVGPVAAFTPWNFPAITPARKIAGALAAGCSCIIKPSEETPGPTIAMVRALEDAGLPAGVMNVIFGHSEMISEYLITSPIIQKVTFTGSTPIGKDLTKLSADGMKRITMELGGHAPVIIFDDVDVDKVVDITAPAAFRNAGQICISPTRFYVQDKIYDEFVTKFSAKVSALKVGDGFDGSVQMGPLGNLRRLEAMEGFVEDAVEVGARVVTGGKRLGGKGFFFEPTVLADVPDSARIMSEEPFGPVLPIQRFSSFDNVIKKANGLPFGLAAYAFTTLSSRAHMVSEGLESGMVGINHCAVSFAEAPFGGVKESGVGAEGGTEGLDGYLLTKFISQLDVC